MKHEIAGVKKGPHGITHYVFENGKIFTKEQAIQKAKAGDIDGVIISHSKSGEEHLRTIADGKVNNNLSSM